MEMKRSLKVALFCALFLILVFCAALFFSHKPWEPKNTQASQTSIDLSDYEQVQKGMSYTQVVDILGMDGALQSESGEKGDKNYMSIYRWPGEQTDAGAVILFLGDCVSVKTNAGLT